MKLGGAANLVIAVCLLCSSFVLAQNRESEALSSHETYKRQPAGMRYRRIFVPADRFSELRPPDYRPIEPAEFKRKLRLTRAQLNGAPPVGAAIERSEYFARLDGAELTSNEPAQLSIAHQGPGEVVLPLVPCSLAVRGAAWMREEDSAPPKKAKTDAGDRAGPSQPAEQSAQAELGLFGSHPSGGEPGVLVTESGLLLLDWSLAGRKGAAGVLSFDLALPACPSKKLTLNLPADRAPAVSEGVVLGSRESGNGRRDWEIELGAGDLATLRVMPHRRNTAPRPPLLRQRTTYTFSRHSVDVSCRLELESGDEPIRVVHVELDAGLTLVAARMDQQQVPWSVLPGEKGGTTRLALELPVSIRNKGLVQLAAVAPWKAGRMRLPVLHIEGVDWSQGGSNLVIGDPLELRELNLTGCYQRRLQQLSEPDSGELIELEQYSPRPAIVVNIAARQGALLVKQATSVTLGPTELVGRTVAELQVGGQQRFSFAALVPRDWIIDSVESSPPGRLEWTPEPAGDNQQRLVVEVAEGLTAEKEPLRIVVSGRSRRSALEAPLTIEECQPVRFVDARTVRRRVHLQPVEPYRLHLTGDAGEESELPIAQLEPWESELLEAGEGGSIVELPDPTSEAEVQLETARPQYAAEIHVDALVQSHALREAVAIRCVPQSAVQRLSIFFSEARESPPEWHVDGVENPEQVTFRRRESSEQAEEGGETWEVHLARPVQAEVNILAVRESRREGPVTVNLVFLPDASSQEGELTIRAADEVAFGVDSRQLEMIAGDPEPGQPPAVAAYRFDPWSDAQPGNGPRIVERAQGPSRPSEPAVIWRADLDTQAAGGGELVHQADFYIRNSGARTLEVTLPPNGALRDIWRNDTRIAESLVRRGKQTLAIDLPADQACLHVGLRFKTRQPPEGLFQYVTAPAVEVNLPVLERRWNLRLAPEFAAYHAQVNSAEADAGWRARLFGPLAPTAGASRSALETSQAQTSAVGMSSVPNGWRAATAGLELPGRRAYSIHFVADSEPTVLVVRSEALLVLQWGLFLAACALSFWLLAGRTRRFLVAVLAAAVLALALPAPMFGLATAVFLGLAVCPVLWILDDHRSTAVVPLVPAEPESSPTKQALASLLLAASLAFAGTVAHAQEAPPQEGAAADQRNRPESGNRRSFRVYIPVDEKHRPTGEDYYIPWSFWRMLDEHEARSLRRPGPWAIRQARYEATLRRASGDQIEVAELLAIYELRTRAANVSVPFPFSPEEVEIDVADCRLDGRPLAEDQLVWDDSGDGLNVRIPIQQAYRLVLKLRPRVEDGDDGGGRVRFAIPPVLNSQLSLKLPDPAPRIEIPVARGAVELRSSTPQQVAAELGASNLLHFRWLEDTRRERQQVDASVDKLLWTNVQPDTIDVLLRLNIDVSKGQLSQLRLAVDRRLQLLPPADSQIAEPPQREAGRPDVYVVRLRRPVADTATIDLRFLLSQASSGVGILRLPRVDLHGIPTGERLLGVSIDETLQLQGAPQTNAKPLKPAAFAARWGVADHPDRAYRLPARDAVWSAAVRPRDPVSLAGQSLAASVGLETLRIDYEAQVDTQVGFVFQHQLAIPAQLEVDEVSVQAADTELAQRFWHDGAGNLTIFLNRPAAGKHRVYVRGRLENAKRRFRLPKIKLATAETTSTRWSVYRRPRVLVEVKPPKGATEVGMPSAPLHPDLGRLVASHDVPGDGGDVQLTAAPNQVRLAPSSVIVTRLEQRDGGWVARVRLQLEVVEGLLDVLHCRVPKEIDLVGSETPGVETEFHEIAGEPWRQLEVRLADVVDASCNVRLEVPLGGMAADRLEFPLLDLPRFPHVDRYALLPAAVDQQPVQWDVANLQVATLPDDLLGLFPGSTAHQAYRVVGEAIQGMARPTRRKSGLPKVPLLDVRLHWDGGKSAQGIASFDLHPAGLDQCRLEMPAGCRLLSVQVGGRPALLQELDGNRAWMVTLTSHSLPQQLLVIYHTPTVREGRAVRFGRPTLLTGSRVIPVESTLWSLKGPRDLAPATPKHGVIIDRSQLELQRLKGAANMVAVDTATLSDHRAEHLRRWYRPWADRLFQGYTTLARIASAQQEGRAAATLAEAESLLAEHRSAAERLGLADELARRESERDSADTPQALWDWSASGAQGAMHVSLNGATQALVVEFSDEAATPASERLAAGLLVALVLGGLLFSTRYAALRELPWRFPHAVAVLIGILWWLLLTPGLLGWIIVGGAILSLLRSPWRQVQSTPPGSTILHGGSSAALTNR